MSKKKHDPVKALKAAFQEQVEDLELQRNYDGFKRNLERAKEKHNELVPQINQNLGTIRTLKESVLNLALEGVLSPEASTRVKELEEVNGDLIERIEEFKKEMEENMDLIEKYDILNERKLFTWWEALKAVDPDTQPWLEWKETYTDKII
jgi:hypothetical protein